MSERRMAERHEFLTHDGVKVAAVKDHEFPGFALGERDDSVPHGHLLEGALAEILRLAAERDALGKALLEIWRGPTLAAFGSARLTLRDAGLLPKEGSLMSDAPHSKAHLEILRLKEEIAAAEARGAAAAFETCRAMMREAAAHAPTKMQEDFLIVFLRKLPVSSAAQAAISQIEARGAARAVEQYRRLAEKLAVREDGFADQIISPISVAQKHRFAASLVRELAEAFPDEPQDEGER